MINVNWLKQNLPTSSIIFIIGSADLLGEAKIIKETVKNSKMYAFDCEKFWLEHNLRVALELGIHYFHTAVFSENSKKMFTPSISADGESHPWSGSFYKDIWPGSTKIYGEPYEVSTIRLDTFCDTFNIYPDFMFIDAEGSEYDILSSLGNIRPKVIWTEIFGFNSYATNKTLDQFTELMNMLGYKHIYTNEHNTDSLYCLDTFEHMDYYEAI